MLHYIVAGFMLFLLAILKSPLITLVNISRVYISFITINDIKHWTTKYLYSNI